MVKKIILVCWVSLIYQVIVAQTVYKLDSVDYLYQYQNLIRPVYLKGDKIWYKSLARNSQLYWVEYPLRICKDTCWDATIVDVDTTKGFIPLSELSEISYDGIIRYFTDKEIVLTQKDSSSLVTLKMIAPFYFLQRYYKWDYNSYYGIGAVNTRQWEVWSGSQVSLIPVQLPGNKWLLTTPGGNNIIMLTKNGWRANLSGVNGIVPLEDTITPAQIYRYAADDETYYKELQLLQTGDRVNRYNALYLSTKVPGGYQLQSTFRYPVLENIYDTIIISPYYIVTQKNKLYEVRNSYLELLQSDVRDYMFTNYFVQCIVGNKMKWLTVTGKPTLQILQTRLGLCGTVPHFHNKIKKEKGKFYFGSYTNGPGAYVQQTDYSYTLIPGNYDSVSFLNGATKSYYTSNTGMGNEFSFHGSKMFIATRSGKQGIINEAGEAIIPLEYDSIVCKPSMDEPLRLYKSNLVQFFPIGNSVYNGLKGLTEPFKKANERITFYVRVTMLENKLAWLNLWSGRILVDE